jgi:hypothetical protein
MAMAYLWRMVGLGALAAALATGAAHAQALQTRASGLTLAETEISTCLCLEREVATRQSELTVRRHAYEGLGSTILDAEAAIDRDRPAVDVNDPAAIARFRRRVDELDALKARQDQVTLPDYQAAVASYNERVAQYTQGCSGRTFDQAVIDQVRPNLICRMGQ